MERYRTTSQAIVHQGAEDPILQNDTLHSSDVGGSCPLDLPDELFRGVAHACPSSSLHLSRSRCCPTLAAWLYSAYSAAAITAAAKLQSSSSRSPDLPVLPDDSEACMDVAEKALRERGVALAAVNDTCDMAYCYCGVRLRPLACPRGLAVERDATGRWVAGDDRARRLERDCALPGPASCTRCLRTLYQLKEAAHGGGGRSTSKSDNGGARGAAKLGRGRDCQLMGLTWLLARNRTLYMPTVTRVLRALMMTPAGSEPLSCTLSHDGMPLAVDSAQLEDPTTSSSSATPSPSQRLSALRRMLHFVGVFWCFSSSLLLLQ
ncbi:hypothetical protein Taro_020990 [Colocasia esculenta]|uniref:SPARK domain-containing protein n=1 Tax=Colocasia esculenta TaxID=4460 RepID=A0A843V419_COLES|nr:hypothetical protein [Colocasia esculenta]